MEHKPTPVRRRCDRYLTEEPAQADAASQAVPVPQAAPPAPQPAAAIAPPRRRASSAPEPQGSPAPAPAGTVPRRRTEAHPQGEASPAPSIERTRHREAMLQSPEPPQKKGSGKKKKKERQDVPLWMRACLIAGVLLIMAGAAASLIMTGWLRQQQEAREEAEQRIVTAHPLQYRDLIERYAGEYNLQPAFVAAIILNESSFNSAAESSVGARGLMQLMPDTAEWIAHRLGMDAEWNVDLLWDPETNIRFGCWYFHYLNTLFSGDPVTVTSAYHTGQGQVSTWLQNSEYSPDGLTLSLESMPEGPTKIYAGRVIRDYGIYDRLYFHAFNPEEEPEEASD